MRVFVTGASGYIGHAVAKAFREKGHTVYGLVRTKEKGDVLALDEIWAVIGDLENPQGYSKILDEVEIVAHCAFERSGNGVERDIKTLDLILSTYSNRDIPHGLIYTSGVWVYGSTGNKIVDESSPLNPIDLVKWRPQHEQKVLKATSPKLRTVVIRPGTVYGKGGGLTNTFFDSIETGSIAKIGNANNHWAMVHVEDLAHAYVSAAEKELTNVILNVTADFNPTVQEMVEAVARSAGMAGKINSLSDQEAYQRFGPMVQGLTIDQQVSNARVKRLLGWQTHHAPFINEIDIYYHAWKAKQLTQEFSLH